MEENGAVGALTCVVSHRSSYLFITLLADHDVARREKWLVLVYALRCGYVVCTIPSSVTFLVRVLARHPSGLFHVQSQQSDLDSLGKGRT